VTTDLRPLPTTPRRMLSVRDLQTYLNIGSTSARFLVKPGGALHRDVVRVGRLVRVPKDAVDAWIDASRGVGRG
jgi:hypothetical protein